MSFSSSIDGQIVQDIGYCRMNGSAGAAAVAQKQRGCTVVRAGVGNYAITLDPNLANQVFFPPQAVTQEAPDALILDVALYGTSSVTADTFRIVRTQPGAVFNLQTRIGATDVVGDIDFSVIISKIGSVFNPAIRPAQTP